MLSWSRIPFVLTAIGLVELPNSAWAARDAFAFRNTKGVSQEPLSDSSVLETRGDGISCCCDYSLGEEDQKCKYLETSWTGFCPSANLGRGTSDTHAATDAKSKPERCELTAAARQKLTPRAQSLERRKCVVQETRRSTIFPSNKYVNHSLAMSLPDLPKVGDLHMVIGDIHILQISLNITYWRKDDKTFAFRLSGMNGQKDAKVKIFLKDFIINTPDSMVLHAAAGLANLDNSPVDITMSMAADFTRSAATGAWEVVAGTEEHKAEVNVGGGIAAKLVSLLIDGFGGMDQIFFDNIFPLMKDLIPESLGEAFEKVPERNGKLHNSILLDASCRSPSAQTCPQEDLVLRLNMSNTMELRPQPVLTDLSRNGFFDAVGQIAPIVRNVIEAYESGGQIFKGFAGSAVLNTHVGSEGLATTVTPALYVPLHLLNSVVGKKTAAILQTFLPGSNHGPLGSQASTFRGKFDVNHGKATFADFGISHVKLPAGSDPHHFMMLDATVEEFSVELVDDGGEPSMIFNALSPLAAASPGLDVSFSRKGLKIAPREDYLVRAELARPWLSDQFMNVSAGMRKPSSVRTGAWALADGEVPKRFQQPSPSLRPPLDFLSLLQDVGADVSLHVLHEPMRSEGSEFVSITMDTGVDGMLHLGSHLWKSVVMAIPADWGYLHKSVAGYFGEFGSANAPPTKRALALMSCGYLKIYSIESGSMFSSGAAEPFSNSPSVTLDIANVAKELLQAKTAKDGKFCFSVDTNTVVGMFATPVYFCSKVSSQGNDLLDGIKLQQDRVSNAGSRWRGACQPGANGGEPICKASPDGTWFIPIDLKDSKTYFPGQLPPTGSEDVATLQDEWKKAVKLLYGDTPEW